MTVHLPMKIVETVFEPCPAFFIILAIAPFENFSTVMDPCKLFFNATLQCCVSSDPAAPDSCAKGTRVYLLDAFAENISE